MLTLRKGKQYKVTSDFDGVLVSLRSGWADFFDPLFIFSYVNYHGKGFILSCGLSIQIYILLRVCLFPFFALMHGCLNVEQKAVHEHITLCLFIHFCSNRRL